VVDQYLSGSRAVIKQIDVLPGGEIDKAHFKKLLSPKTAAVLIQSPSFFGVMEPVCELFIASKKMGALNVLCANPLAYGIYASAGELGADIAVGDLQPFGLGLQFGGPYAGYIACTNELVRQLPGRIAGETVDTQGRRGFVLTLQAREQHIRREKATSNICTNQALAALSSLIAMLWYGRQGIPRLALTNFRRASYLKEQLEKLPHVKKVTSCPIFNEFLIESKVPIDQVQKAFRQQMIEPGLPVASYFPERSGQLLIAVTETKDKKQLDRYLQVAKEVFA
jgi:glycine dehydrogenase subunit 1